MDQLQRTIQHSGSGRDRELGPRDEAAGQRARRQGAVQPRREVLGYREPLKDIMKNFNDEICFSHRPTWLNGRDGGRGARRKAEKPVGDCSEPGARADGSARALAFVNR